MRRPVRIGLVVLAVAVVVAALSVLVLTSTDFRYLLDENPKVQGKVMRALARRVAELSGDPAVA